MEMLTIAQASELTGKSEHAIRRLIKHLLQTDTQTQEQIKQEPIENGSFRYAIDKKYLLLHMPRSANAQDNDYLAQPKMQGNNRLNGQNSAQNLQLNTQGYAQLLIAKEGTIQLLTNQLKQRDEQLKQKDEQIRQLLERGRETNILLKGYQDKYLLAAPKGQPAGQKSKPKKVEQPKKKRFFSWFS